MTMDLPAGVPNQMLIGGKWLDSDAGTFDVLNPATGEVLTTVPAGRVPDMKAAVDAAAAALPAWRETAPRVRSELLRATWQIMQDNRENLARLMTLEMGKTLTDANGEVTYSSEFFRWFAEEAVRIGGELRTAPSGANKILTFRQPVGVALLVTPWNFPAAMATRKIAPALAAGCTVVVKPAGETPLTTLYIASLMEQVGVPAGVVNVVTTDRAGEVVDAALEDDRVRKISFTGSTGVGRILLKKAADRVIASSMELGGNDPFLVLADADVDAAVDGAMIAKMRNGGQACTAANRFLVHRDVADEFATKLAARMGALKMGSGLDDGVELGPMVSEKAVTGIADLVDRSVAAGATAVIGGTRPDGPGFFYPATVLTNVPADAPVATAGDLRPGRADHRGRLRRGGARAGQRHRVRAGRLRLQPRSGPRPAGQRAARGRHGRPQPRPGLRPGRAVRRRQGIRPRPRRWLRRHRRIPRDQIRRRQLVADRMREAPIELVGIDWASDGVITARRDGEPSLVRVQDIGDAIQAAIARGVELVVPADLLTELRANGDLPSDWLPDRIVVTKRRTV